MVAPRPRRLALLTLLSCSPSSPNRSLLAGSPAPQPTTSDVIIYTSSPSCTRSFLRKPKPATDSDTAAEKALSEAAHGTTVSDADADSCDDEIEIDVT